MARFEHDCSECKSLGEYQEYDLYYCEQGTGGRIPTVIARYGNRGEEYLSGLSCVHSDWQFIAIARAADAGHIKIERALEIIRKPVNVVIF